ncbi:disulfide bond formation protein DsbB [Catenovulum sediminis]|uniref:Disulfide bond formation protein B n=1 Tax=Catenovulum sediminis TaxID=1740262 RepID=A0ABV1RKR8_9ALTE|nr:disulfide bond formation protein DsbB [Catenovulum sediminis]
MKFNECRIAWLAFAASLLLLEIAALVFQYSFGYEPCIKCIYQRLALWGVFVSALPAVIFPKQMLTRLFAYVGGIFCSLWGYKIASEHVELQNAPNPLFAACEMLPNFPEWFKPDVWFPALFEARGDCAAIDWTFLSMSMPEWMKVIFLAYAIILTFVLVYHLIRYKQL